MKDFNEGRAKRHEEREEEFGSKPFLFGHVEGKPGEGTPGEFFVRANVGYLGIKRVAALSDASSGDETFDAIEKSVFSMIDPENDAMTRFKKVIANIDDPITFDDLVELQGWLLEEQTSLPPTEPASSATSSQGSGKSSTETSSNELGEASTN